jgi:hypothetical protein
MEIYHQYSISCPYMVTWVPSIYPIHVSMYTSTMDLMGCVIPLGDISRNPTRDPAIWGSESGSSRVVCKTGVRVAFVFQSWTRDALRSNIKLTSCSSSRYIDQFSCGELNENNMRMTFICHSTPFLSIFVMSRVSLPLSCSCHVCICLHLFAALSIDIYVIMNWVDVFLVGGLEHFLSLSIYWVE